MKNIEINDNKERQCPRLGGIVSFSYCRSCGDTSLNFCFKILDCWWEYFDVAEYIKEFYSEKILEKLCTSKPKPKVFSIIEIVNQVKANMED
ncbi:MAG: hypothetical protein HQK76_00945 [Desulfobacterales bacterium]|nr:hypothetical protein [Desulfobacterales bacterium]